MLEPHVFCKRFDELSFDALLSDVFRLRLLLDAGDLRASGGAGRASNRAFRLHDPAVVFPGLAAEDQLFPAVSGVLQHAAVYPDRQARRTGSIVEYRDTGRMACPVRRADGGILAQGKKEGVCQWRLSSGIT